MMQIQLAEKPSANTKLIILYAYSFFQIFSTERIMYYPNRTMTHINNNENICIYMYAGASI